MRDGDALVQEVLERQVPVRADPRPDWADVLRRAEISEARSGMARQPAAPAARRRPRRRLVLAVAVAVAALVAYPFGPALAGLGRNAFDGLGSWLRDDPGTPAPAAEQAGFSERNAASYAAFPTGTQLRLLLRPTVAGKEFSLLGFRSASSLCLRLVRADLPGGRGANECVTQRELTRFPAPALVVSETTFRFGRDALVVAGIFGFADDTVRAVEVRRVGSGWSRVGVASNVFLTLRARPSGSVDKPRPYDPIVQVRAVRRDGGRVRVPFVALDSAVYARGIPGVPSYLTSGVRPEDVPGPKSVDIRFRGGTIGWLEAGEDRGEPFSPARRPLADLGSVVHARRIQPDPESPTRVGVWLLRVRGGARMPNVEPGRLVLCLSDLRALSRGPTGSGCLAPGRTGLFGAGPLVLAPTMQGQLTELAGLAVDGVSAIDLFLASGRAIPAALRDNAFAVQVPTVQLPGKLVAYDDEGRVLGIHPVHGPTRPVPCPRASIPSAPPARPEPYERVDLGTGRVDGHEIFGRGVAEVIAALGRPDRIAYFSRTNNTREPTLFYGGTRPGGAALQVGFGVRQKRLRAVSLLYQSADVVDARVGPVLRMQPPELQRRIVRAYAGRWELDVGYGSRPEYGCVGTFSDARRKMSISFGANPHAGSRPTLGLWHRY